MPLKVDKNAYNIADRVFETPEGKEEGSLKKSLKM
jgi:hypothetical protein